MDNGQRTLSPFHFAVPERVHDPTIYYVPSYGVYYTPVWNSNNEYCNNKMNTDYFIAYHNIKQVANKMLNNLN